MGETPNPRSGLFTNHGAIMQHTWLSLVVLASVALAGCNEDPGAENGMGDPRPTPLPPSTVTTAAYPPPPYEVSKGSTIDDFGFNGFVDAMTANGALQKI